MESFLNGVLRPKLLNEPFASSFLINIDFLLPRIAHFDNSIVLLLLVFEILGFMISVFFYTSNNTIALFCTSDFKLLLIISLRLIVLSILILLPSSIRLFFSVSLF